MTDQRHIFDTEARKLQPLDVVQRAAHYNDHPSGVECIEIVEHMTFNIGNAVKYLWRGGLKMGDPQQDYEKALWYAKREDTRSPLLLATNRQIEAFRSMMLQDNRARRVLARPSPWCEPVRRSISFAIDWHCTDDVREAARISDRMIQCIDTAIADCRYMGEGMQP